MKKTISEGGRASYFSESGYTFDKGPSWYMMPEIFDNFFSIFGFNSSDFYKLKKLKNHYKVYFDKNKQYIITDDVEKNANLFENIEKGPSIKFKEYLKESEFFYKAAMKYFVNLDYTSLLQLINPKLFKYFLRLQILNSLHSTIKRKFKNKEIQKILEFSSVFLGGSPYNTPAFYSLVAHADFNLGIYHPLGGIYKIVEALIYLCKKYNVKIITNQEIKK